MHSENFVAGGHPPVHEGRLLQIANAIGIKRDPIMTLHHFAGSFGVDGVDVVEKWGIENTDEINCTPQEQDNPHGRIAESRRAGRGQEKWLVLDAGTVRNGKTHAGRIIREELNFQRQTPIWEPHNSGKSAFVTFGRSTAHSSLTWQLPGRDTPPSSMNSATTTEAGPSQSLGLEIAPSPLFSSLIQDATLEFYASLQLLAERVRFLTGASGVAVAVHQGDQFVYCASSGASVCEIGGEANLAQENIRECLATSQSVRSSIPDAQKKEQGNGRDSSLVVPLKRTGEVAGFFELVSSRAFEEQDVRAAIRVADLASTVLEHRDGAEHAEVRMFELKQVEARKPVTPVLWHAPARVETSEAGPSGVSSLAINKIHACSSCGFPVSDGRTLCVECERSPASAVPQTEMFTFGKQESWISAHGYTVASLLVTALVAAIIYWLR